MALRYSARRILIRCPNWIGDAITATASIRCVRQNYPEAHITLLLEPYVRPVMEHTPWVDEIVEFGKQEGRLRQIFRIARELRQPPRYDLVLLLTHSFSSSLVAWLSRAKIRVGHAREGRSWLLTDAVSWPGAERGWQFVSKVRAYASLLGYLGCKGVEEQSPKVFTSPAEEAEADELLRTHGREADKDLLAIVPGAAYGSSKLWSPESFAAAATALCKDRDLQPLILTGPGESAIGREIADAIPRSAIRFDEGEMSFGHLKALVHRSTLMICNDTGPRHLAIAYKVPVVVIMGPTDPAVTESDYEKTTIVRQPVHCAPCYLRRCPEDHQCMTRITSEMVATAAEDLLQRFPLARQ